MATEQKLRIAIVGAGIGGLTLSAAIDHMKGQRYDLQVDIYEASSRLSEIGAGINFWPRTWEIMRAIGLDQKLLSYLSHPPEELAHQVFQFRKGDQEEGVYVEDAAMEGGSFRFHRADVQRALLSVQKSQIHLSHRLVSYEEKCDEVHLHFEGDASATCHLLVGMDGIKSVVRKCFLTNRGLGNSPSVNPVWSGDIAYRSLIPFEKIQAEYPGHRVLTTPMIYIGKSKHLISYPVSQDRLINFVAITGGPFSEGVPFEGPTTLPCTQEEILTAFKLWEKETQVLFRLMEKPAKWVIRYLKPLDRYSLGRVLLGGDAAHAMTPYQGAGAGQAIEDAYILATLLCDKACTQAAIPKITEIYDAVRRPVGNEVLEKSSMTGRLAQFTAPGLQDIVEGDDKVPLERLRGVTHEYVKSLEWVWKDFVEVDRQKALSMLHDAQL